MTSSNSTIVSWTRTTGIFTTGQLRNRLKLHPPTLRPPVSLKISRQRRGRVALRNQGSGLRRSVRLSLLTGLSLRDGRVRGY